MVARFKLERPRGVPAHRGLILERDAQARERDPERRAVADRDDGLDRRTPRRSIDRLSSGVGDERVVGRLLYHAGNGTVYLTTESAFWGFDPRSENVTGRFAGLERCAGIGIDAP